MQKKRRTYWLVQTPDERCQQFSQTLSQRGFEVHFFHSVDAFNKALQTQRASVIILSDDIFDASFLEAAVRNVINHPEIQGARLILASNSLAESIANLAACGGFRDMIPLDLPQQEWISRFLFATAGKPLTYKQPVGHISLNQVGKVALPARITHVTPKHIRFECRLTATPGTALSISGPLATAFGQEQLLIRIVDQQRQKLLYRFSDALIAEWSVPEQKQKQALEVFQKLLRHDAGPKCRLFVAVQSTLQRSRLLQRLNDPRFDVSIALQKQSLAIEPKFFTPDVVIIEDGLCSTAPGSLFEQMLEALPSHTMIIVIGSKEVFDDLHTKYAERRLVWLQAVPQNLSDQLLKKFTPHEDESLKGPTAHILTDSYYSYAMTHIPARIMRLHPKAIEIQSACQLSPFALARVDTPFLRRSIDRQPFIKVTATSKVQDSFDPQNDFYYKAQGYFADLSQHECKLLGKDLQNLLTEIYAPLINPELAKKVGDGSRGEDAASASSSAQALQSARAASPSSHQALDSEARTSFFPTSSGDTGGGASDTARQHPSKILPIVAQTQGVPQLRPQAQEKLLTKATPSQSLATSSSPSHVYKAATPEPDDLFGHLWIYLRRVFTSRDFRRFIIYTAVISFLLTVIWTFAVVVAPHYHKSGDVYSDQLKKFAPHLEK